MNNAEIKLKLLLDAGVISEADLEDADALRKRKMVADVHHLKIWQGSGNDKRWKTWVRTPKGRKKIQKQTEAQLYEALYRYYFGKDTSMLLPDIYEQWLSYKLSVCRRPGTVYRLDLDYKKYYVNDPVSQKIMSTSLPDLTRADLIQWGTGLVKKHSLTYKQWQNISGVLRQVYGYLLDQDLIEKNPMVGLKLPSALCRPERKKSAQTEIFYPDEMEEVVAACRSNAEESGDTAWLAIPLCFYTGLRIGECLALTFGDFDQAVGQISVNRMLAQTKYRDNDGTWKSDGFEIVPFLKQNAEARIVMAPEICFSLLAQIIALRGADPKPEDYLFPDVRETNVQMKLYRICRHLGITERSPHKCRKTYISLLMNAGINADYIRTQVGHKDLQTTYRAYTFNPTRDEEMLSELKAALPGA